MADKAFKKKEAGKLDSKTLKRWDAMTDANDHLEVRVEIAERFGNEERASFFRSMIECRDDCTHWNPVWYSIVIIDVTKGLLKDIAEWYGESVAAQILACL